MSKQHIKVRAVYNKDAEYIDNEVKIKIVEQSNNGFDFGNTIHFGCGAFKHSVVVLVSASMPEIRAWNKHEIILFVRGYTDYNDSLELYMSNETWKKVKKAIIAYNEKFAE